MSQIVGIGPSPDLIWKKQEDLYHFFMIIFLDFLT